MIVLQYVEINGTIGDAKIDLKVGIPVEQLLKNLPTVADLFIDLLPDLKKKFNGHINGDQHA